MVRACSAHAVTEMQFRLLVGYLKERDCMGDIGLFGVFKK